MGRHSTSASYRPDVQGLRAIAILMVVLLHLGLWGIHGGVMISFLLSGYLNGGNLLREIDKTGRVKLSTFWAKRFRRIAPSMAIVSVATLAVAWWFGSFLRFREIATDGLFAALSCLNWRLAVNGTDYFAHTSATPYQHMWSLSIEEQFYLVAPFVLLLVSWLSHKLLRSRVLVGAFFVAVIAVSFYLSVTVTESNQPMAYFSFHTNVWALALGVLLAVCKHQLARMPRGLAAVLSWVGLATILVVGSFITEKMALPGWVIAGPVLGAALVIASGESKPVAGAEWLLGRKPFNFVGNISYSLYLWHWPLLIMWPDMSGRDLSYADRWRVLAVSLLLAALTHFCIAEPLRQHKRLVAIPWLSIAAGGAITSAIVALSLVACTIIPLHNSAPSGNGSNITAAANVSPSAGRTDLPSDLRPSLEEVSKDKAGGNCGDNIDATNAAVRSTCKFGDPNATDTVVLFGDSHALQWAGVFDSLGKQYGFRLVVMVKGACSPGNYPNLYNPLLKRTYTECSDWRKSAIQVISGLHPRLVVVTGRTQDSSTVTQAGMEETLASLKATGAKVAFVTDTPFPGVEVPDCLAQHPNKITACDRTTKDALDNPASRARELDAARAQRVLIVDAVSKFCTDKTCPAIIGSTVVYFDYSHVTNTFALTLKSIFEEVVTQALT